LIADDNDFSFVDADKLDNLFKQAALGDYARRSPLADTGYPVTFPAAAGLSANYQ
jgi:hypothetical protein